MEQLQQAASDVEAKLDREIQLRSKTDGEVEQALAAFEQSKADIDTAITRKAEEFQDQVARRHAQLLPIATDCNEALEEIQRLEKSAETLDASCNSNTKFLSTRHKQLQELKGALDRGAAVLDAHAWPQRGMNIVVTTEEEEGKMPQLDIRIEAQ